MADDMALFNEEIGKMGAPAEELQGDTTKDTSAKRGRSASPQKHEAQEMAETEAKPSLAQEAVRLWKQRKIDEDLALEVAGQGKWTEHKDADSGVSYYYNPVTSKSSWTRPPDYVEPSVSSLEASIVATNPKWSVSKDPGSGQLYYFNKENNQSSWELPADFATAEFNEAALAAASTSAPTGGSDHALGNDPDADEVIDLVADTKPSEISASDEIYARVLAESEEGVSIVGFTLRLNTTFAKLFEAWSDYQDLPAESIYFEFSGGVLGPGETPGGRGWTLQKGILRIEAKPCEECTDSEAEDDAEADKKAEIAKWKKGQKKQRGKDMKAHAEAAALAAAAAL